MTALLEVVWEEESEDVFTSDEEEGDLARLITNNNDDTAVELNSKSAFAPPPSPGKGAGGDDGEVEAAWAALRQDLATARAIARRLASPATQHQPGVTRVRLEPGPGDTGAANSGEYLMLNIIGLSASICVMLQYPRQGGQLYPACGALLGSCLGGPVGFLAGVKIGGLAAVGGGLLGE